MLRRSQFSHSQCLLRSSLIRSSLVLRPRTVSEACTQTSPFILQSQRCNSTNSHTDQSFFKRLRSSLNSTKIEWYPIPVGLGIGFLGLLQYTKIRNREARKAEEEQENARIAGNGGDPKQPKKIRPTGPWYS